MRLLVVALLALVVVGCDAASPPPSMDVPASGPCAGIPLIPRDQAPTATLPLTRDLTLESRIPTSIDGHALTDLSSGRWVETLCMIGGEDSLKAGAANLPAGLSLDDMRVASALATVDGAAVTITAFRLPGHAGSEIIPALGDIAGALGGDGSKFSGAVGATTVAGKDVATWTDPTDGSVSYLYPTADTLFVIDNLTPSQADKVFAALA